MPRHIIDTGPRAWIDIGSYARHGPGRRDRLSPAQMELALAVRRFMARMPAVQTEKEWSRDRLLEQSKVRHREERTR